MNIEILQAQLEILEKLVEKSWSSGWHAGMDAAQYGTENEIKWENTTVFKELLKITEREYEALTEPPPKGSKFQCFRKYENGDTMALFDFRSIQVPPRLAGRVIGCQFREGYTTGDLSVEDTWDWVLLKNFVK